MIEESLSRGSHCLILLLAVVVLLPRCKCGDKPCSLKCARRGKEIPHDTHIRGYFKITPKAILGLNIVCAQLLLEYGQNH